MSSRESHSNRKTVSAPSQSGALEHQEPALLRRRDILRMTTTAVAAAAIGACASRAARRAPGPESRAPMDAAAFHAARRFARTRFGSIAYVERGSGDAAVFLHGFPLNGFQWRGALDRLSAHRRCIAPDLLGLGYTEVADGQSVAPEAQVAMVLALLDQLGISTADVVANDSGGAVAQLLVARHPRRVRTLLLTNCDVEHDSPPAAMVPVIEMARAGTYVDRWLAPWLADKQLARSANGIGGMTYSDPRNPTDEAIETYFAPLVTPRGRVQVNAYAIALERDPLIGIEPALQRCGVPVRIVWGTGDTIFSSASPDYLDNCAFAQSRGVRRVAGAKLFFPEEYPDVIAEEARRLWGIG